MTSTAAPSVSGAVHSALDALLDADLSRLEAPELLTELQALASAANRLAAAQGALLVEIESRRLAGEYGGTRTTAELLVHGQPMTAKAAADRVELACALAPRRALSGEVLPAVAPATAEGCAAGTVSPVQASVVVDAVTRVRALPAAVRAPELVDVVESTLVEACPHEHEFGLRRMADQLVAAARACDDDSDDEPTEPETRRGLSFRRAREGQWRGTWDLTDRDYAQLRSVLDPLAAPAPAPAVDGDPAGGDRDQRSAAERRGDALMEVVSRVQRSGTLPVAGGAAVTVVVTMTLADLVTHSGTAVTADGDAWPVPDLLLAASGGWAFQPVLIDDAGAVLCLGREQRLANRAQRRALGVRDGGCCFPGCNRPVSWTEAHHITPWSAGGRTDVRNLCLLCGAHHRMFEAAGWEVRMAADALPEWLPPPWLDPLRRPRQNTCHVKAELRLGAAPEPGAAAGSADPPDPD